MSRYQLSNNPTLINPIALRMTNGLNSNDSINFVDRHISIAKSKLKK